jgi:hypothetical protein
MPIRVLNILLFIFQNLNDFSQIANRRNWVIFFSNLSKHYSLCVLCSHFTWEKCIHLLLVNPPHKLLHPKISLLSRQKSEVRGQKTDTLVFVISQFEIRNPKCYPMPHAPCPMLLRKYSQTFEQILSPTDSSNRFFQYPSPEERW